MTPRKAGKPPRFSYVGDAVEQPKETKKQAKAKLEQLEKIEQLALLADARDALTNPEAYALPPQQRGRPPKGGHSKPLRTQQPREQMNVRIRPELKRAAAMVASGRGVSLGDVVEAALIEHLKGQG